MQLLVRHLYPDWAAGEQAAKARLAALNRSTANVRLDRPGRCDVFTERTVDLRGFKSGLDGAYLVESVEQVFSASGWTTTLECKARQGKARQGKARPGQGQGRQAAQA
ncbi:hypothetical protein [Pseudomonas fluorescens]|uniref:hypothetical protein n=1 Tax=Pseudomonas fluorescens TaxID=294 RepID=UPI001780397F|nr:hypothetical protein [Pseudomonas fluorescens]